MMRVDLSGQLSDDGVAICLCEGDIVMVVLVICLCDGDDCNM